MDHSNRKMRNGGFSLIEVLVVTTIMSVVSLALGTLIVNLQLGENNVKFISDANNFNEEVRSSLSSSAACTNSFNGRVASAGASYVIANLRDGSASPGVIDYSSGSVYGDSSVTLTQMVLDSFLAGTSPGTAQMTLELSLASAKNSLGAQNLLRTINVSLQIDAANRITSCVAMAKMSDGLWQRSPLNLSNIFFSAPLGGNVGIGTSSPATPLDVVNAVQAHESGVAPDNQYSGMLRATRGIVSGQYINMVRTGHIPWSIGTVYNSNTFGIGLGTLQDSNFVPNFTMTQTGNVGIGSTAPLVSLDVNGSIRPGTDAVVLDSNCDAAHEGSTRYNRAQKQMQFCDGTQWTNFSRPNCHVIRGAGLAGGVRVSCPANEWMLNGGAACSAPLASGGAPDTDAIMWASYPQFDMRTWFADCVSENYSQQRKVEAYVWCCK